MACRRPEIVQKLAPRGPVLAATGARLGDWQSRARRIPRPLGGRNSPALPELLVGAMPSPRKFDRRGDLPSSQLKSSSDPPIAVAASDADSASGGSYIDGFNIPCAAVASF